MGEIVHKFMARASAVAAIVIAMAYQPSAAQTPAYNWTGFYIGSNFGYGWGDETRSADAGAAFLLFGAAAGSASVKPKGALLGGQTGFNLQFSNFLFGMELQGNWADLNVSKTGIDNANDRWESRLSSLYIAAVRLGAVNGKQLTYLKGGFAGGELRSAAFLNDAANCPATGVCSFEAKKRYGGWMVGAGYELMISPNWTAGFEYNYIDLGSKNIAGDVVGSVVPSTVDFRVDPRIHTVMLRMNFFPR
jgi:outer membrane immunogenic protein